MSSDPKGPETGAPKPLSPAEQKAKERAEARARAEAKARAELGLEAPAKVKPKEAEQAAIEEEEEQEKGPGALSRFFKLREELGLVGRLAMGGLCLGLILLAWWIVTRGPTPEERIVGPGVIGSPREVFGSFGSLWFDRALSRNTWASLLRVLQGYGLALLIGIPLGILAGCFRPIKAFLAPITMFFRNVPVVALLPITMLWFGIDEASKVGFLVVACFAFVIAGATDTIASVDQKYLDTAATLGATRWQTISKVLVPLALPDLFTSMRMLFGLAFGYIIVAEMMNLDKGLGMLIIISQRRGPREHAYLCLLVIALLAFVLDRILFWIGNQLFPYRVSSE